MMELETILSSYSELCNLIIYTLPVVLAKLNKMFCIVKVNTYIDTHKINVDFESSKKHLHLIKPCHFSSAS